MNLIKEGTRRGLIGLLMGLFASYTMFVFTSLSTEFITISSHLLVKQYMIYAISGFYFTFITIIFSMETLSVKKRILLHGLSTLPFLPIAYMINFMPHTTFGITSFTSI